MADPIFVICYFCRQLKDCHTYGFGGSYASCDACAIKNKLTMDCEDCGQRVAVRAGVSLCESCEQMERVG